MFTKCVDENSGTLYFGQKYIFSSDFSALWKIVFYYIIQHAHV